MKATLKVFRWKDGYISPDSRHMYGGIDSFQLALFSHLEPKQYVDFMEADEFIKLAYAHDWEVKTIYKDENFLTQ